MALNTRTQKSLLLSFILSIVACGLVGIYCLVLGTFGQFEERVLITTALVGASSILSLASAIPWERRRWHPIGPLGVAAIAAAFFLAMLMVWRNTRFNEDLARATMSAWIAAIALPHIGLISLAKLKTNWRFIQPLTAAIAGCLACQLILMLVFEADDDELARLAGILGIAVGCGTISLPILHRVSAIDKRDAVRTVELSLTAICPRCNLQQSLPAGHSKCAACSLRFNIEIEENNCPKCGYSLYKIESGKCPECGTAIITPNHA